MRKNERLLTPIEIVILILMGFMIFWHVSIFNADFVEISGETLFVFNVCKVLFWAICLVEVLLIFLSSTKAARIIGIILDVVSFFATLGTFVFGGIYSHSDSRVVGWGLYGGLFLIGLHVAAIAVLYILELCIPAWMERKAQVKELEP